MRNGAYSGVDTESRGVSSTTSGWSKEAIFTLLSVFLTVVLAMIGFTLRYYVNKGTLRYRTSKRGKPAVAGEQHDRLYMYVEC